MPVLGLRIAESIWSSIPTHADPPEARYISCPTRKTLAVVLAGVLTNWRTKPAVPFAGKFRTTDFALSNCLNADIGKVCVLI